MTRDEIYESDRGEREYYESQSRLEKRIKLPITRDGCEALLEQVTKALEIPLDDYTRQVFGGHIHHIANNENSTTLDEIGKVLYKNMANFATWKLDQEAKERIQQQEREKKAKDEAKLVHETTNGAEGLTLAKDANGQGASEPMEHPSVQ